MSCIGFLSPEHRAALAASRGGSGPPLSSFASPPATGSKVRRVQLLAAHRDRAIRESAALSCHAPVDVLERLTGDAAVSVRACVARNPRAPEWVLRVLADDEDPRVRGWVAANPACHPALRAELAEDEDAEVGAVVGWADRWVGR
ncbi:hypothetical protein RDV89_17845 [Nocardioides zeae]|uniref:Leucine rich repeat variant domain-containing protein n=1 Tax=Nocardioides imazamoxiresistens TaxID=3231893 RepID=A0ABU3Q0C4_9ACTN|nr:hypothetical protein [Nocardioides zeae]MDT9594956.1 hypothetical protein [Nocardioides zeae]